MEALSGPGEPAQAGLHRRDLHEDQHVAQARLGPQGTKGSRLGPQGTKGSRLGPPPLRPSGNLLYLGCAILLPPSAFARVGGGAVNGDAFRAYVETQLVPTPDRGDIVVMDTPGSHKTEAVRAAIRGAGAHLPFLPPCSPDPDPIEQAFAKLKHFLRKDRPRSRDDLWKNVGSILEKFTPEECSNCLANSGCAVGQT